MVLMANLVPAKLKATHAFIDVRPSTDVTVTVRDKVIDNSGGHTWNDVSSSVLTKARFVPQASTSRQLIQRVTADGVVVTPGWFLVCLPDAVMKVGDHVTCPSHGGDDVYEVVYVHFLPNERVTAELWRMQ